MREIYSAALQEPHVENELEDLLQVATTGGGRPRIDFYWKEVRGKRRLIGNPNKPMRKLHELFGKYLRTGIHAMGRNNNYLLRRLPSSAAFVEGSNPLKNAQKHVEGRFFYITDIWNAYPSIDLERLASLVVYIRKYDEYRLDFSLSMLGESALSCDELKNDPLFPSVHTFLESFCSGMYGQGLAVGGPLSPFLFNLYCEVFMDAQLRRLCEKYDITYTRYADDCVFSRNQPIIGDMRKELRRCITRAGFKVNHRKSKVLSREMGTVSVTKIGLRDSSTVEGQSRTATLVFPQNKRRRLHGMIGSYLVFQMDWPEKVSGLVAEFIYYYKNVEKPTATDHRTFALCKKFETDWSKHR
ncbi:MAG: reverse transcriptase domain-containing protein [Minisyncoccota bacterium]